MTAATVKIDVEIDNPHQLWLAARARFVSGHRAGEQAMFEDFCGTENAPNLTGCLITLFDPNGSPPGVTITDSFVYI